MSHPTWRRVEPGWYWAGWMGSASGYRSVMFPPVVGPYRSMTGAREALVSALRAQRDPIGGTP